MSKSTLNKWIHILRNEATLDILALYGLGESLEHPEFSEFCAIANKELKMPVQLNSDSHAIKKFAPRISSLTSNIGKLVVTYKDMKGLLTRKIISNIHSQKLVHCFIIPELTQDYVMQIDNYISDVIYAHPDEKFAIVPKWDCEFGNMPTLKRFDTNDVKILGEPYQKEFVMKAYICWDGTLRKCFFDHRKFKSIDDIINTTSCEDCTALQQIYRIWVNTPEERKIGLKAGTIDGIYYSECGAACAY